jgi:hypothetical protein
MSRTAVPTKRNGLVLDPVKLKRADIPSQTFVLNRERGLQFSKGALNARERLLAHNPIRQPANDVELRGCSIR